MTAAYTPASGGPTADWADKATAPNSSNILSSMTAETSTRLLTVYLLGAPGKREDLHHACASGHRFQRPEGRPSLNCLARDAVE